LIDDSHKKKYMRSMIGPENSQLK